MNHDLPITERDISRWTETPIRSPILCAAVDHFGVNSQQFLGFYSDCFTGMPWDWYDVKRAQWESLPPEITRQADAATCFTQYYLDPEASLDKLCNLIGVDSSWHAKLQAIRPWRRRSVCCFEIELGQEIEITRVKPHAFQQRVEARDLRSLPRVFNQTDSKLVDHELFYGFLRGVARHTQRITPHVSIDALRVSAHFMSVQARSGMLGTNAPEGPHEDGADFIVSALVINRKNVAGGRSQVFEKMRDGRMVKIFERELGPGEFIFQADTGEEKHYGNDLWHYVTPLSVMDPAKPGVRDIIGLDVSIG